ncbi:MAG: sigma-70 family RNA polymerase sigma factor [Gemmataceae bacterium]|nr:sigma-70 family RNA polymerase sigma factor [Gemmataceae bacterium]
MADASHWRTSATLLARLRCAPTDEAAWREFVQRYGRIIYGWCRRWRLQEADAQDVTQTVLLKLADKLRTFAYDPSRRFRGWLKTLTHHAWRDFLDSRQRADPGTGDSQVLELLETIEAREDLVKVLEEEFDHELLDAAMARVQQRVQARTWEAFRLLALEGRSGAEAAAQLHMNVAAVFVAKSKVQKMLQQEVRRLEESGPEPQEDQP